eukprot:s4398_g7.t1
MSAPTMMESIQMLQQPDSPVASAWQEKAVTVGYTLLVVFAVKGLTSLWSSTTMTTKGKTDEPSSGVPEAPANKTDKTMIVDSPKKKDDVRPKTVGGDGDSTTTPQTTTPQKPDSQAKGEAPSKEVKTPDANTPSADPASRPRREPCWTQSVKASTAPPITAQQFKEIQTVQGEVKALHADVKGISARMDEFKTFAARLEGIEKVMGVMSSKIGPMSANIQSATQSIDAGFKENSKSLISISSNVRGNHEDGATEAKERHQEQGSWLSSTEAKLVEGIKEVLKKITNTDYASSQLYTQKIEGIANELLAAMNFTQTEVAEIKEAVTKAGEEVHIIREMCERPLMTQAHPPSYRAPIFPPSGHDSRPAPSYDPHVAPRSVNLQQALPLHSHNPDGITVSPDGRSLNIPLS